MKIKTNKKRAILSALFCMICITLLVLNSNLFFIVDYFSYGRYLLSIFMIVFASFLFAVKIEFKSKIVNIILNIIIFIVSIVASYSIMESLNQNILFSIDSKKLLFNFIIIIILHLLIYVITNKINITVIITSSLLFILGVLNYTVVCFRGVPIVPWDILSIKTAAHVASTYTFSVNHYLVLATIAFVFLIALAIKANYRFKVNKINIIARVSCFIIITICTMYFYKSNVIEYFKLSNDLWRPQDSYAQNGFLASFVQQSKNLVHEAPENYSVSSVEEILANTYENMKNEETKGSYATEDLVLLSETEDETPNIIVIMNESFCDLSVNGDFETDVDYMPYFKVLEDDENAIVGNTHVSVYGGTTPNSEWEFLTNNSMFFMPYRSVPYQQYITTKSPSLATVLKEQGYVARAIHPFYGSGYRRNAIYPLFGFNSYDSIETMEGLEIYKDYTSDRSTYDQIIKQYEEKGENEKLFNFTVTMQNHSAYGNDWFEATVHLTDIENCPQVEQFLSLIRESNFALEYLIDYFRDADEKTVILMFGDHQPNAVESEFFETVGFKDAESKYITSFVIWANYDIDKEQYQIDDISLNYLSILLMDIAGLNTTPYMEFLREIQEEIPVIIGNGYRDSEGNYYTLGDEIEYSDILEQYQIVQYNNVFDAKHRVTGFFNPRSSE